MEKWIFIIFKKDFRGICYKNTSNVSDKKVMNGRSKKSQKKILLLKNLVFLRIQTST